MPDKVISATLQVGSGTSNENIKEVNENLDQTSKKLDNTTKSTEKSTQSFSNLKSQISEMPGPLGNAADGVNKVNATFKALLANPIVLVIAGIVAALAALYKAFTSTNDGADKMEQIFSGVGATINVIRDRILKAAGSIVKFFSGDFKGALADARAAVSGIGQEIADEFQAAANATKILQDLDDELRNLSVSRAKLNADLAEAKEKINDSELSLAERRANIAKVREAEAKQNEAEIAEAQKRYEAIKARNDLSDKSDEKMQEEAEALIKLENLRQQSASQVRQLNKLETSLIKEEKAKQQEANRQALEEKKRIAEEEKALLQKQKEDLQAITGAWQQYVESLRLLGEKKAEEDKKRQEDEIAAMDADFAAMQENENKQVSLAVKSSNEQIAAENQVVENKKKSVQVVGDALNAFSEIVGRQTVLGKILGSATALINTYQGATEALKQPSTLPSPFDVIAKIANVSAIIATGLKAVREINRVQVPGGGGATGGNTGSPISVVSPNAPLAPVQASTAIDQNSINGIGDATSRRTYVLSQDISKDADRNERLNRAARLGG